MKHRCVLLITALLFLSVVSTAHSEDDVPPPPLNLSAEAGDGHVNLTWEHPAGMDGSDITSYWVYWYPYPGSTMNPFIIPPDTNTTYWMGKSIPGNSTSHTFSGLDNGMLYFFHVRAYEGDVEGEPSNLASAKPKRPPSEPRRLTGDYRDGEVFVDWEPPEVIGDGLIYSYYVLRGTGEENMDEIASLSFKFWDWGLWSSPPTNYTDDDLGGRKAWYYQVVASNSAGRGPPSNLILVGEGNLDPVVPSIPQRTRTWVQDGIINITWSPPGYNGGYQVNKYRIYSWTEGEEPKAIGEVPYHIHYHYFLDVYVRPGVEYHYSVTAINVVGESPHSLEATPFIQPPIVDGPDEPSTPEPPDEGEVPTLAFVGAAIASTVVLLVGFLTFVHLRRRR